jgi:hypothetical protein
MQNSNGIVANEATALRELSLDEAEMVGGGFSIGGFLHGAEHLAKEGADIVAATALTTATATYTAFKVTARLTAQAASKLAAKQGSDPYNFGDGGGFDWFDAAG